MPKRDKIFFAACGVFTVGLVLAIMDLDLGLLFLVGAYLLRPTLHAFDLAMKFADERQVQIHSRSGNIAFIAVMLAVVGMALGQLAKGEQPEAMYAILSVGIGARAITGLLLGGDFRKAASIIIMVVGSIVALFIFISEGFSTPSFVFGGFALSFVLLGVAAIKFPRAIALVLAVVAFGMIISLRLYEFRTVNGGAWMVVVCLLIAAACLFRGRKDESDEAHHRSKRVRAIALGIGAAVLLVSFIFLSTNTEKEMPGKLNSAGQATSGPVEVQGVSCLGYIEYYPNGKLKSCTLACEDTLSGQPLAEGTVVSFTDAGALDWCFLQKNIEIQGHLCKGEGHGFMTCFHPNGKLRLAWLGREEVIEGIPVAEYNWWADAFGKGSGTYFWENGKLRRCRIGKDIIIEGHAFLEGDIAMFDQEGKLSFDSADKNK
jgi:hypothetical protein